MLVQILQPCRHDHESGSSGLAQNGLSQAGGPRFQRDRARQRAPLGQVVGPLAEQVLHHRRLGKTEALMKDHRHHLGRQLHHLHQETDFRALFCQPLAQHILALRVRNQVVQLGLVGRTQVIKVGRKFHEGRMLLK